MPILVSCDLVALTLDEGQLKVLVERRHDAPYRDTLALPRAFVREQESPEVTVLRLAESLGVPGPINPHQVSVFGASDRDPQERVLAIGWLLLTPEPWPVDGDRSFVFLDEAAGTGLGFDHELILAAAAVQLSAEIESTLLATQLCPVPFTLAQLRAVYEEVWQVRLDAANFHRKFTNLPGVLKTTGEQTRGSRGRPATLYVAGERWRLPQRVARPEGLD